jgi:hypothetical protein
MSTTAVTSYNRRNGIVGDDELAWLFSHAKRQLKLERKWARQDRIRTHFESYLGKALWKWLPMDVWKLIFTISEELDRKAAELFYKIMTGNAKLVFVNGRRLRLI